MSESPIQALIFDCDGVLVDTERDGHRVAFNMAFKELNIDAHWDIERYGDLLSTGGGKERLRRHFDEVGWPVAREDQREQMVIDLHKVKTGFFLNIIESGALTLRDGVARMIDAAFEAGLKVAVCSTSNERAVATLVWKLLGDKRSSRIQIFAGDVVKHKKPDPAIYHLAATTLSVEPTKCVVVEDSHIGLSAAKAAGMNCIITISAYTASENFDAADHVVSNLDQGVDLQLCEQLVKYRKETA